MVVKWGWKLYIKPVFVTTYPVIKEVDLEVFERIGG